MVLALLLLACAIGWWSYGQGTLQVGYTLVRLDTGSGLPVGTAVFSFTNGEGVLVTEAGVAAVEPIARGRIFVDEAGTRTGVALVNPEAAAQVVNLTLRDAAGTVVGEESLVMNPGEHVARFADELFGTTPGFEGSLTFESGAGLGAITLRQSANRFGEPLFTTLPVADLDAVAGTEAVLFPHLAAGGGFQTQVILINTSGESVSGRIRLTQSDGTPLEVDWDGVTVSENTYQIEPNGVYRAELTRTADVAVGYAVLTPEVGVTPSGSVVFQFLNGTALVTEAGVGITAETTTARISLDNVGRRTGVAVANRSIQSAEVQVVLQDRYGVEQDRLTETLPAGGHLAKTVQEWFPTLASGFTGILEIQSSVPVAPITLQITVNSRGELVLTTLPVADPTRPSTASLVVFPHIVIGAGFATRLIFMNQDPVRVGVEFFASDGTGLVVPLGGEISNQFTFDFASNEGQQFFPGDTATVASLTLRDPVTNATTSELTVNRGNVVRPRILVVDSTGKARQDIPLTLTSLDPAVATADSANRIEGIEEGFSTLTIVAGGLLASATIKVVGIESGVQGGFVTGIAQDLSGQVFLASSQEHTVLVADRLDQAARVYAGTHREPGFKNDERLESQFQSPSYLALDQAGTLYVSENHRIREVTPGPDGRVETLAGGSTHGHADGEPTLARFNTPQDLAVDEGGYLWVVDQGNHVIRRINLVDRTIETVAGRPGEPGFADGTGSGALFDSPTGIVVEPETAAEQLAREFTGDPPPLVQVLVADTGNGVIRRVSESGEVETIQLSGVSGSASTLSVQALVIDSGKGVVRRLSEDPLVSAIGTTESSRPIQFSAPVGVAVTAAGVIYVAERDSGVIQTILPNGDVVEATETGTVQTSTDLAITSDGSLLVASPDVVRQIDIPPPTITGATLDSISGDGGELVVVEGKNFTTDTFVDLAGKSALNVTFLNTKAVSFITLPVPLGTASVRIFNRGGSDATEISVVSATDPFPEVFITNLTTGQTVSGAVTVEATATDNRSVQDVQLRVGGVTLGTDVASPYDFIWDTTTASDGTHKLTAVATDDAGNQSTSAAVTVTVDNRGPDTDQTPPPVFIDSPLEGASLPDQVIVAATASDDVGVAGVTFRLDGSTLGVIRTEPYMVNWDTTTASNGPHILTATAIDASGNRTTSAAINVTVSNVGVDTTLPEVLIASPVSGATVSGTFVRFEGVANDDVAVDRVEFSIDGTPIGTDTSRPYFVRWDTTTTTDGPHTLTAIATDSSENPGTPAAVSVVVSNEGGDRTLPTVAIRTPAMAATVSGASVPIFAEASDNLSSASVQFFVDGILLGTDTTAPYSIQWDTTATADGFHDLTAIAGDTSGNIALPAVVSVNVLNGAGDTTLPKVAIGTPSGGATVSGRSVLIRAVARDDIGVASVQFLADGVTIDTDSTAPYSILWDTTGVSDGFHNLAASATDTSGNAAASDPIVVLVANEGGGGTDTEAPRVSIGTPTNGSTVSGTSVLIGATATDDVGVATIRFLVDGLLIDSDTEAPYSTQWDTTGVTNGLHDLRAVASDRSGNTSTSNPIIVRVSNAGGDTDTTAPTVSIKTPASGATVSGNAVSIQASATDSVGVASVEFQVNGLPIQSDTDSPYSAQWDTTVFANGLYELTAVATDLTGNSAISDPVVVRVANAAAGTDAQAPAVSIDTPANGATVSGTLPIGATATDDAGLARVRFLVDGMLIDTVTIAPYLTEWDTTTVANGLHELRAVASDVSGNRGVSEPVIVRVSNGVGDTDTTAPSVFVVTPADGATVSGRSVLIGVEATDDVGVATVEFLVDGIGIGVATSFPYSIQWDTTRSGDGSHDLSAVATDLSGNVKTSETVTVTVSNARGVTDTTAPVVTLDTPADGDTVSGTVTIGATAEDDVGVARVRFLVDGAVVATDTEAPYTTKWDTTEVTNGVHGLGAVATDLSGNPAVSNIVAVRVSNEGVGGPQPSPSPSPSPSSPWLKSASS